MCKEKTETKDEKKVEDIPLNLGSKEGRMLFAAVCQLAMNANHMGYSLRRILNGVHSAAESLKPETMLKLALKAVNTNEPLAMVVAKACCCEPEVKTKTKKSKAKKETK